MAPNLVSNGLGNLHEPLSNGARRVLSWFPPLLTGTYLFAQTTVETVACACQSSAERGSCDRLTLRLAPRAVLGISRSKPTEKKVLGDSTSHGSPRVQARRERRRARGHLRARCPGPVSFFPWRCLAHSAAGHGMVLTQVCALQADGYFPSRQRRARRQRHAAFGGHLLLPRECAAAGQHIRRLWQRGHGHCVK